MDKALLAKWFWKLETKSGLWQSILLNKYVPDGCVSRAKLGDGHNTRFQEDIWGDDKPLKLLFLA